MAESDSTVITIFIVSALIVLVLVATIVLFVLLYQRKVLQQQMMVQHLEVDFQKELLAATLESQEVERRRIARDLHDSVGVMLSTLRLLIKQYGSKGEAGSKKQEMVEKSSEIIGSTIATVRRLSHNLLPPELEMLGLQAALEQTASGITETEGLHIEIFFPQNYERLTVKAEMILFRIAQELLNNTLKHSGASEAEIRLEKKGVDITFTYRDNGKGFPDGPVPDRKEFQGLGMKNIESRARSLDGSVSWGSTTASGMHFKTTFKIPQ